MQFAGLGLLGCFVATADLIATRPSVRHLGLTFGFLVAMVPVLLGGGIYLWAIAQLKDGVQNGIWKHDQLAPLRRITQSPFFTAAVLALTAVFLTFTIFKLTNHDHRLWGWTAYLFLMYMQQLQMATRNRAVNLSTAPRIDWRTRAPLQSDHWGQR